MEFLGAKFAQIEDGEPEAASVENHVGGLEGVLEMALALDPEQPVEGHAGGLAGGGAEGVAAIDQSAEFALAGGGGQSGLEQGGAAGGAGACNFGDRPRG